tara:strand:- start:110 stop:322 length:213 start_codon:yes stop_codon:yes gene_type:complete
MNFDPFAKSVECRKWVCDCGHTTEKPLRWVYGSKTRYACDRCHRELKQQKSHSKPEWPLMSECIDRKDKK